MTVYIHQCGQWISICIVSPVSGTTTTTVAPSLVSEVTPTNRPIDFKPVTPSVGPTMYPGETPTSRPYCDEPMGVSNPLIIPDNQLTASTAFNYSFEASNGRLTKKADGHGAGAWIPRYKYTNRSISFCVRYLDMIFFNGIEVFVHLILIKNQQLAPNLNNFIYCASQLYSLTNSIGLMMPMNFSTVLSHIIHAIDSSSRFIC